MTKAATRMPSQKAAAQKPSVPAAAVQRFVALAGKPAWRARMLALRKQAGAQPIAGRVVAERHAIELAVDRLASQPAATATRAERAVATLADAAVQLHAALSPEGRARFEAMLAAALVGEGTLVPLFHLLRVAALQRARGFAVRFSGFEDGASHDLLISRRG